ncbi:hypothetical protein GCM10011297_02210 [Bacterioplanes sanyensis]|uniref:hypothetical protein n=1 Tax=Bacterioplanes sanyensis TaxID=1249553 RepID=UPI00167765B9|nr:hypothetical protein [Bacterioplanes sanyensis]GGY32821.1 hypothetical protein GCM10011297_02210 [Bacterioplanes sanyensis]
MKVRTAVLAVFSVSAMANPCWAAKGDEQLKAIYKLPVWVAETQRVCPWRADGGEGYVRVIRTSAQGQHRLFFQWIRKGIAGGPTEAISTVAVEELEQQYQVRSQLPEPLKPGGCELQAMAEDIHSERRYLMQYELSQDKPGHYHLDVTHKLMVGQ